VHTKTSHMMISENANNSSPPLMGSPPPQESGTETHMPGRGGRGRGCSGRGWGRGNQNRNNGDGSTRGTMMPTMPTCLGNTDGMKGNIFQCHGENINKQQFLKTVGVLGEHINKMPLTHKAWHLFAKLSRSCHRCSRKT
jgi:hypothetical protein